MAFLIEQFGMLHGWLAGAAFVFLRYLLAAGLAFLLFYILLKQRWKSAKIQKTPPSPQAIAFEVGHSALSAFIFAGMGVLIYLLGQAGLTQVYGDPAAYGWLYLPLSFAALVVIHDAYFYWMHRLIHHPRLFRLLHRTHHHSHNPTPWAALSFHPLEAVLEIAIVPVVALVLPLHPLVLFLFATWALLFNIMGHLGYELFPPNLLRHPIGRWFNTPTHHNMHHRFSGCNYGLYFNFWDTAMGTNHPNYAEQFEQIARRAQQG